MPLNRNGQVDTIGWLTLIFPIYKSKVNNSIIVSLSVWDIEVLIIVKEFVVGLFYGIVSG